MAMTVMTAAILGAGVLKAGAQIGAGYEAQAEAEAQATALRVEARGYEEQADILEAEKNALEQKKIFEGSRYARQRRQMEGTIIAKTARSGFKLSGSPIAVLTDNLTQFQLDESIGRFNIELEKYNVSARQRQYRSAAGVSKYKALRAKESGKASVLAGYTGAFASLLKTGVNVGSRFPTKE